jgi:hypothetical protein
MQIAIMNLKSLWERHRARLWAIAVAPPSKGRTRRPYQPLRRNESIAILNDTIQWLMDEARATMLMPDGLSKERRMTELRARDKSIARDFQRLVREQEG